MNPKLIAIVDFDAVENRALPDDLTQIGGANFLQKFISTAISLGFIIGAIVFLFMLISGAIMWITSKGEVGEPQRGAPGPLVMAKKQITAALIGLVLLFCVYAIIRLVGTIFGIDLINNIKIPTLI